EAAIPYAEFGLQTSKEIGNRESEQDNLNTLALIELGLNNYTPALNYAQRSLEIAKELKSKEKLRDVNLTLSTIFQELGQHDQALTYFKAYTSNKDSVLNATQSKQISELRTIYETEKKDQEIAMLAKERELDQIKKTRLWIGLLLSLGLGSLLIFYLRQKRKKDNQIFAQQQIIEQEKTRNAQLEATRLERELEFKQKELTAKVLQLARKNDFLQVLDQEVNKIREQSDTDVKNATRKLSNMIHRDVDAETDWDDFLSAFKQVHTSFIETLTTEFEDLTTNDVKLACLFKMHLSSKEIASALNVTPAGIKKARHRLRKRLQLEPDQDIHTFFIQYPTSKT
ncbi:MAG: tetratricopeptide repeat protein, partial [Saprospiraceae bacterium]|nr:tetratricopeptide repeat protein [Saprospiraceae bacterium]